ncbi:Na/Pi cotransporter family protein [[Clostridium] polysaccharolyticum]|uniref:Phosphate:Na+ symporter n=1 Tax=[Clostridium] polysaccharolyticum TaxID=29364 RepID=A0A1I0DK12_9FIRM|nr:Na/Pi cotransporter family protein [[Clostridium] polysaccharolyticum]SET32809.1 phosphate:Na+ symporter [[Clostridium] polysaccharolyticum]
MDIFGVLTLIGGLALFLFGMNTMGNGLEKVSGGKLEKILEKLTSSPVKAVLLGAGVTAVIQSSSATTVMVVGFVNSEIMKLSQSIGIIMGANIGTTVTSWILSLSGIESENLVIQLLKPTSFSPVLAIIGVFFILFSKKEKKKDIGSILIGFAILMTGMEIMSGAVKPLANEPAFTNLFIKFENPVFGLAAGAVLTAIIQSSSASVGILQALCKTGTVTYGAAFPIIMGQNIGTCVTALISSAGAKKNAKRAAFIHFYFNVIGTTVFMMGFYALNAVIHFQILAHVVNGAAIAVIHSAFNIGATLLLLPFSKALEKLACATIRETEEEAGEFDSIAKELDSRFLDTPGYAVKQCQMVTRSMADLVEKNLEEAMGLLEHYDQERAELVTKMENQVDHYEDVVGTYLIKLSSKSLTVKDSQAIAQMLHCIGDFERISDHASNIMEAAREMQEKNIQFSVQAKNELSVYQNAVKDIVKMAKKAFVTEDPELAKQIEPLEETVDYLNVEIKERHVARLGEGKCTIELGFVFNDLCVNFERIADHCSNIGLSVIQVQRSKFDAHEYIFRLKHEIDSEFRKQFDFYKRQYTLPQSL